MNLNTLLLFFVFCGCSTASSQNLAAYLDYMDRFWVFDHGEKQQLESYKLVSFQVLNVYCNGEVRDTQETLV